MTQTQSTPWEKIQQETTRRIKNRPGRLLHRGVCCHTLPQKHSFFGESLKTPSRFDGGKSHRRFLPVRLGKELPFSKQWLQTVCR